MKKVLDKLLLNKLLSGILPVILSTVFYLLFAIFGDTPDKLQVLISTPVVTLIWFLGVYLVIFIQIKNQLCPEWFLNTFELVALIVFGIASINMNIQFLISIHTGFSPMICLGFITWSSISCVHKMRL